MNETECDNLIKSVKWTEPSNLISLAILEFINVLVIGGNLLVIAAVFCSNKLRSVTNFFIVNLAVADLLVGLAVLPFSATWEVFKVWIFGDVWCRIWLAVDVWMCTASILNLCAISLDRYVAVTRPVTYPSIMSTKKAKSLIAGIWVLSFVICFPPLVGWKDQKPIMQPTYIKGNYTLYYATSTSSSTSATIPSSEASIAVTASSMPLIGVAQATDATLASLSLKYKRNRKKRFTTTTTTTTTTTIKNSSSKNKPVLVAQHTKRHLNSKINSLLLSSPSLTSPSSSSSLSLSSSPTTTLLYNSFNPYDPYYAHLRNHITGNKILNNQVVNDNEAVTAVKDTHVITTLYSDANANAIDDDDINDDDSQFEEDTNEDYQLTTSDSSEYISKSYNGHNDPTSALYYDTTDGHSTNTYVSPSASASLSSYTSSPPCPWKCELTNDRGYVLYSALGSFYIPMFVMLFFYWRIYRAAVRTTRAINQGFKTTKGSPHESRTSRVDENQLVLRIHRGRPCSTPQRTPLSVHSMSSTLSVNSNQEDVYPLQHHYHHHHHHHHQQQQAHMTQQLNVPPKRATSMRVPKTKHEKVSIKVSFPSSENMLDSTTSLNSTPPAYASVASSPNMLPSACGTSTTITPIKAASSTASLTNGRRNSFKSSLLEIGETTFNVDTSTNDNTPSHSQRFIETHTGTFLKKSDKKQRSKRSVKFQVKRFKVETKAAKTLAIIVGGFIFCWLPFFTMYLIRAFCDHCIQPTVFSVLFWLGYCNSAINPLIYALFSHEFRIAFKRIVCRCVCTRSGFRASENFQMIAARALMAPATFHKTISGCSDEADGDGDGPEFS